MITRSELLESKLPAPDISTSPSGLYQAEEPRQSHPKTLQAFDVASTVQTFVADLPPSPKRFKPVDYRTLHVCQPTSLLESSHHAYVGMPGMMSINVSFCIMHGDARPYVEQQMRP